MVDMIVWVATNGLINNTRKATNSRQRQRKRGGGDSTIYRSTGDEKYPKSIEKFHQNTKLSLFVCISN